MSKNPIAPMQATATQPVDSPALGNAKKPAPDGTACPVVPPDRLTQSGAPTTSVDDYRAAIQSVGAATWGAAQRANPRFPT